MVRVLKRSVSAICLVVNWRQINSMICTSFDENEKSSLGSATKFNNVINLSTETVNKGAKDPYSLETVSSHEIGHSGGLSLIPWNLATFNNDYNKNLMYTGKDVKKKDRGINLTLAQIYLIVTNYVEKRLNKGEQK